MKESKEQKIKTVSVTEILKAGGADKFAVTKGIDTRTKKLSGRISVSKAELNRALAQLKRQG